MNNRYVYVFPGTNTNTMGTIEMLDLGTPFDIKNIKSNKWFLINVANGEFSAGNAYGCH